MAFLLSIDGSDMVAYASLSSAKRAAMRAKSSAWIVKEIASSGTVTYETVYTWDSPQKRR